MQMIISGGQSGADLAGLEIGKALGLKTGGWMPRGFRTEDGPKPEYAAMYGVKETRSAGYSERTLLNVKWGDATIIFGDNSSAGCALTIKYCRQHKKPYLCVSGIDLRTVDIERIRDFLNEHQVETLNVAGNRENRNPGINELVRSYLEEALLGRGPIGERA